MPGFCYFLPAVQRSDLVNAAGRLRPAALQACGLLEILDDVHLVPAHALVAEVKAGPSETEGLWLLPCSPDDGDLRVGYHPDLQTWRPLHVSEAADPAGAPAWIGWYRDALPRPRDLARREQILGYEIRDAHGEDWSLPVLRAVDNPRGNLGWAVRWQFGRPVTGVVGRHAQLWADSARLWDLVGRAATTGGYALIGAGWTAEEDQFAIDLVLRTLQINYRVDGRVLEVYDALRPGWLSQATVSLMANAVVDMHARRTWEAAQKKTESPLAPDGVNFSLGDPGAM